MVIVGLVTNAGMNILLEEVIVILFQNIVQIECFCISQLGSVHLHVRVFFIFFCSFKLSHQKN